MACLLRGLLAMLRPPLFLCALLGLGGCTASRPPLTTPRPVTLRFLQSPYADYLFFLFYRDTERVPALESVPLGDVPTLDSLIALPEMVASSQIERYEDIFTLLTPYQSLSGRVALKPVPRILAYSEDLPSYEALHHIVTLGQGAFPAFLKIWREQVLPEEERTLRVWREQAEQCAPMERLQTLTRLRFPSDSLDVASLLFHPSGSANYSPPGVYSSTFPIPNLPWTLGHEATHLLVDVHVGANWQRFPSAPEAIQRAEAAGLKAGDLEEALSLLMQVKLAQACGTKPLDYRISARFEAGDPKRTLLEALEQDWEAYLGSPHRWPTVVDYLVSQALAVLPR
ncbi:hypothetical protein [Corallococcus sp. AB038B]|uniref:hypothetical protein n=1 Tax=Corallococcus sp. AB038B TaxID=2316718 RepID=UPI000EE6EB5A|nr:hypothetical protein [Corallococcus sp. AB038B]RKI05321.1 hypothetical protein D7Y04_10855 [Corallococcus sp. AB038B]